MIKVLNRDSTCIDFRFPSVTNVIVCKLLNNSCVCFAEIGCVFLRCSRSTILVLARRVCFLRCSRSFSWLWCKWSRCDCLVDILRVFEKTGCSFGLEWTSINNCVHFLYPYLFNSVLLFWNWYKQPIVSLKQPIVFPALCFCCLFWKNWILNQSSFKVFSF